MPEGAPSNEQRRAIAQPVKGRHFSFLLVWQNGYARDCKSRLCGFESRHQLQIFLQPKS